MKFLIQSLFLIVMIGFWIENLWAQASVPDPEQQIYAAISPAPEAMQDGAKVLGYNEQGELITLRNGSNDLICLADNPNDDRFHTACYHKDLEPFMKRGRELRAGGMSGEEVRQIRLEEIENGDLSMPENPVSLYSLTGDEDAWDYSTHTLRSASPLYVIYIPYATVESTGLTNSPVSEGAPWLMDAGKPWAHIMVGTGRQLGTDVEKGN
jgi:hypothetical protein